MTRATASAPAFFIPGPPRPKGSWKALWNKHLGRCVLLSEMSAADKAWREQIVRSARAAAIERILDGPIYVEATFWFDRPKAADRVAIFRAKKPDLDKLLRALFDGLTGVAWTDDNQVSKVCAEKVYTTDRQPDSGASVRISALPLRESFLEELDGEEESGDTTKPTRHPRGDR